MRTEVIGPATLILGDCREVLPTLGRVDAVVTSPPYWEQREYSAAIENWTSLVSTLAATSWDAQVLVNLGMIYRGGEVLEYWEGFKYEMKNAGWKLFGWYVWDKGFGLPAGDQAHRPMNSHEWIFHFCRAPVEINKWVRSKDRTIPGKGIRQADGTLKGITSPGLVGQRYKAPDTVIRLPPHQLRGEIENAHPAIFPVGLPSHLIQTFTDTDETILDPFMGSGTTGVACLKLGRKFIGIEIHEPYFDIACRRIEEAYRHRDLFIPDPIPEPPEDARLRDLFSEPEFP